MSVNSTRAALQKKRIRRFDVAAGAALKSAADRRCAFTAHFA
jgi:hypothetical protein